MLRILAPILAYLVDRHDRKNANRHGCLVVRDCSTGRLLNHITMENKSVHLLPVSGMFPIRLDYC